jgi:hypothetical protein
LFLERLCFLCDGLRIFGLSDDALNGLRCIAQAIGGLGVAEIFPQEVEFLLAENEDVRIDVFTVRMDLVLIPFSQLLPADPGGVFAGL